MERRIYTAKDGEQMNQAEAHLRARGLDEQEERIVDIIDGHFQMYRSTPVTVTAVVKLIESQTGLKWLTPAELEYRKTASVNPQAAQELVAWLNTQGKPGQLVNSGDAAYENLTLLLGVLRGYEISPQRIADAMDRISHRAGRQLHVVPQPRRTEPVSAAAKADADYSIGKPFSGDMIRNPDGSLRSKNFHEQRADIEAAERAKQPNLAGVASAAVREAQRKAESLKGNTHSEDAQIGSIFVTTPGTSEIDWPSTLAARENLQRSLNRHREVSRFIR